MTDSSMKSTNLDILSSKPYFEDLKALKEGHFHRAQKEKFKIHPATKVSKVFNVKDIKIKDSSTPNVRLAGIHPKVEFSKKKS